jgi:hypothetical protein
MLTLIAFVALSAWAGGQGTPPPLPAATQVKLFKTNRDLIASLVDHGIDLADADNPLGRARECRLTARALANALRRAADEQDPNRVAELAGLFGDVVRDGLVPNLDAATREMKAGDPREPELLGLRQNAVSDFNGVRAAIPTDGKVGDSDKVKAALAALDALKPKLGQ